MLVFHTIVDIFGESKLVSNSFLGKALIFTACYSVQKFGHGDVKLIIFEVIYN